jgi:hypothetical protein
MSSLNSRGHVARRTPGRALPSRKPAAQIAAPCITEGFGGTASGFGPDQPWSTYLSGGAAPHRTSEELLLAASTGGAFIFAIGRADTDAAGIGMTVSDTVTAVGTTGTGAGEFDSYSYNLLARMEPEYAPGDMAAGIYTGWQFYYMNYDDSGVRKGYAEIGVFYDPSSPIERDSIVLADNITPLIAGDELSLTVTGTGTATVVTGKLNGATVVELSGTDLTDFLTAHTIDPDDLPAGLRGGGGFVGQTTSHAWDSGNDDQVAIASFSVCPA